ncbi:MAG: acetyl-CoA carboxylase biotin carboxyl carrier protein subunit [Rhodospirillales bacterium]|nr:acetyl-CoA carboxylase biotin carboxyl carrier protein subunit [Rhodospirillales bacterium]MDE0379362.1 acetyl-CoA carboxylase biotin carboxyl carrier protein subunit [Rhodospirillales bacterium]
MSIERKEVEALIRIFDRSDWHELRLETDGLKLVLSKDADAAVPGGAPAWTAVAPAGGASPQPAAQRDNAAANDGMVPITAPNLGTFYRAPKPGAAPYVEVGQSITEATEVCLIEVMKLFTPVRAGISGRIVAACVDDGEMVEFGAPLFLVEPEAGPAETA